MKKLFWIFAILAVSALVLSACGAASVPSLEIAAEIAANRILAWEASENSEEPCGDEEWGEWKKLDDGALLFATRYSDEIVRYHISEEPSSHSEVQERQVCDNG